MDVVEALARGRGWRAAMEVHARQPSELDASKGALVTLTDAIERVQALHPEGDTPFCAYCAEPFPCQTRRAVDGQLS